jgi:capsular polysaccharide biosynthesis protein
MPGSRCCASINAGAEHARSIFHRRADRLSRAVHVKRILNALMARQQKLLGALHEAPKTALPATRPVVQLDPAEREALLARERAALDEAAAALSRDDTDAAWQTLEPFAASAQDTRTLTTLSRIASLRGRMEEALALLQQAEALDGSDAKVLHFMAELMRRLGRHVDELHYRRRAAFGKSDAPPLAFAQLIPAIVRASPQKRRPMTEIRIALERVKAAPDLAPGSLTTVAEALFGFPSTREEAVALYARANPPEATEHDTPARRTSLSHWCASNEAPMHQLDQLGVPGRRPAFAQLRNAVVVPALQWLPFPEEGRVVLANVASRWLPLRGEDPSSPLLMTSESDALVRLPKQLPRLEGPLMLIGGSGAYYSDLVEFTGALAVAETLGQGSDLRLLVNDDLAPHQVELFALLGVAADRLVRWDRSRPVLVDELWLPTRLVAGDAWCDHLLADWYRSRLASVMAPGPAHRKIYLTADGSGSPPVQNEAEVVATLATLGFEPVAASRLSVREAVRLFSEATHVVSAANPALANLLFAHPGASVTFLAAGGQPTATYENLARSCGHEHQTVHCATAVRATGGRPSDTGLSVNCEQLLHTLEQAHANRLAG